MMHSPEVEVRCPTCNVSFPLGTRRCLHCGGPTVAASVAAQVRSSRRTPMGAAMPEDEAEDEQVQLRRGPRTLTVLWILAALAASLYHSCATPG